MYRMDLYKKRHEKYSKELKGIERTLTAIGYFRLLVFVIGLVLVFYSYFYISQQFSWVVLLVSTVAFLALVSAYGRIEEKQKLSKALCHVNSTSIQRLKGQWTDFTEKGEEYMDKDHPYTKDLDIFGHGSLFQWISICETDLGRKRLASSLSRCEKGKVELETIQQVAQELAVKVEFREKFNALTYLLVKEGLDKEEKWWEIANPFYRKMFLRFAIKALPTLTIITTLLHYGFGVGGSTLPSSLIGFQFIITLIGFGKRGTVLNDLYHYSTNLKAYKEILMLIEKEKLAHFKLQSIRNRLVGKKNLAREIEKIEKVAQSASNRNNLFFFPINALLLWDYQSMVRLESWKEENVKIIDILQDCIGELEFLSNIAKITYDNPHWCFPILTEDKSYIRAESIGHPLIQKGMVVNDVFMDSKSPILLITGSNMSGKSTMLRTLGINLVLAYAGAPVCAKELEASFFNVHTSMRISDDLEKGISSFYGELLRIKEILKSSDSKSRQSFVLLDEIFKGTNSYDRHLGAKALIKQLLKMDCMGLVSTHDLELEVLEKETQGLAKNYHFQEYYINDEIQFDYKIKLGVSKTRNAIYLLKLIGIEGLEEKGGGNNEVLSKMS